MTFNIARASAASVPGRIGTQMSARATSGSMVGLMATILVPRALASRNCFKRAFGTAGENRLRGPDQQQIGLAISGSGHGAERVGKGERPSA